MKPLPEALRARLDAWRRSSKTVVFTNGCFDLLHAGHVRLLESARAEGDALVVGLNSDESVRRLKGPRRPVLPESERAEALRAIESVDDVLIYEEDTPLAAILALRPDVLVKGSDWDLNAIVGRAEVESWGGRVARVDLVPGRSTSRLIDDAARTEGPGKETASG
jgi:D-beta-D-heptose 7-phosphate kinase/D-beta-D-heptose 1-phosphate adenosyltransferase